jgi:hypothetical protein
MLNGKYWYLDLLDFLLTLQFKPSKCITYLLIVTEKRGRSYLLNYVNDMLNFRTEMMRSIFCRIMKETIHLRIIRANTGIKLRRKQILLNNTKEISRYFREKKLLATHCTPLPSESTPSCEDCSRVEKVVKDLLQEYSTNYASCILNL